MGAYHGLKILGSKILPNLPQKCQIIPLISIKCTITLLNPRSTVNMNDLLLLVVLSINNLAQIFSKKMTVNQPSLSCFHRYWQTIRMVSILRIFSRDDMSISYSYWPYLSEFKTWYATIIISVIIFECIRCACDSFTSYFKILWWKSLHTMFAIP